MEKVKNLTISEVIEAKRLLIQLLESGKSLEVDLSGLEEIDISGIQLLISFNKEVAILKRTVIYKGVFKEEFKSSLNSVLYLSEPMTNGEELSSYIDEIIRSS